MTKLQSNQVDNQKEPGLFLGLSLIALLVLSGVAPFIAGIEFGPVEPGLGSVLMGIYKMTWGAMFLASYVLSHKTFFFRGLLWVCEHLSSPGNRKMAFFYSALALGLGSACVLAGIGII